MSHAVDNPSGPPRQYASWPWMIPAGRPMPATLPGGKPWPTFCIVTPSFNQGQYIEETILSVMNQNYPNIRHILIDGGSTDQTLSIAQRYRGHFQQIISEPDKGQSDAINKGFALAEGDYFTWLNSDDQLAPGALYAAAMGFAESDCDLLAGICRIYRDGVCIVQHLTSCADGQPLPLTDLLDLDNGWNAGQFFYQPEVFFSAELWRSAGGHVKTDLYYSMDYELWLRYALCGAKLHVIGRPLAHYRQHAEQKTHVAETYQPELAAVRREFLIAHADVCPPAAAVAHAKPSSLTSPPPLAPRPVRVALLNDVGFQHGAGVAHQRIGQTLAALGWWVLPVMLGKQTAHGPRGPVDGQQLLQTLQNLEPDLLVVGNLHGALDDPAALIAALREYPTAVVMHDAWMLTGRCAYYGDCGKYLENTCDVACPTASEYPALALEKISEALRLKRELLRSPSAPLLLGYSRWMRCQAEQLLEQMLRQVPDQPPTARVAQFPVPLPLEIFKPRDRATCRDLLELPQDRFLILFSACSVQDPRKGMSFLVEALKQLPLPDVTCVCIGQFEAHQTPNLPDVRMMGYIEDPIRMALLYSAVDLFVGPSLEESFGQVFAEAIACGTPAIGFARGGVPDAIGPGGIAVAPTTAAALAQAIQHLYDNPALRRNLAAWGRLHLENEHSPAAAAQRLNTAFRLAGWEQRLALSRKLAISQSPQRLAEPRVVPAATPIWRAMENVMAWEGPFPQWHLPRVCWLHGPQATLLLNVPDSGLLKLVLTLHNNEPNQLVQLFVDNIPLGQWSIPQTDQESGFVLPVPVSLTAGEHHLTIRPWKWALPPQPPLAMMLSHLGVVYESNP